MPLASHLQNVGLFLLRHPLPFLLYALGINAVTFFLYASDKRRAKRGKWRISEATLLLFPALGGGLGGLFGMYLCRHKTKHLRFRILVPLFYIIYTLPVLAALLFALPAL